MTDTPNLGLTPLLAAQSQKHATVNEAFRKLDLVVQPTVLDKDLSTPPGSPAPGDKYLVGASATGAWAGQENNMAGWIDGAWFFASPKHGWVTYVADEDKQYAFDGTDWAEIETGGDTSGLAPLSGANFTGHVAVAGSINSAFTLEGGNHRIVTNDGGGNFIIRIGHDFGVTNTGANTATEAGFPGVVLYNQGTGTMSIGPYATASQSTGDIFTATFAKTLNVSPTAVSWGIDDVLYNGYTSGRLGQLGLGGATADANNVLSMNGPSALFNNAGSNIRLNLNKASVGDTASFIFQNNFSARAEIGLTGTDDFTFKVTSDGSTFYDSLVLQKDDGRARFPNGAKVTRRPDIGGRLYCYTDNRWSGFGANYGVATENHNANYGTAANPSIPWNAMGVYVRAGEIIKGLEFLHRVNEDATAFDIRLTLHHGALDGTWNSTQETNRIIIHGEEGVTVGTSGTGWLKYSVLDKNYTVPADGFLLLQMRPVGTITATRYIYFNGFIEIITDQ